jgi:hypothetical protein
MVGSEERVENNIRNLEEGPHTRSWLAKGQGRGTPRTYRHRADVILVSPKVSPHQNESAAPCGFKSLTVRMIDFVDDRTYKND